MQAQKVQQRFADAERMWSGLDQLIDEFSVRDRLGDALFDALVGERVTRRTYIKRARSPVLRWAATCRTSCRRAGATRGDRRPVPGSDADDQGGAGELTARSDGQVGGVGVGGGSDRLGDGLGDAGRFQIARRVVVRTLAGDDLALHIGIDAPRVERGDT